MDAFVSIKMTVRRIKTAIITASAFMLWSVLCDVNNMSNIILSNMKSWYIFIGRCIQSEGTSVPHRECFCEPGFHGQTCQKQSPLKLKTYKPEDYTEIKLQGDKFKFLWRYIGKYENFVVQSFMQFCYGLLKQHFLSIRAKFVFLARWDIRWNRGSYCGKD